MSECTCHKNYTLDTLIPKVGVITDIREETPDVKTFRVNAPEGGKLFEHMPGQCAMLCAPGISEGMFSITSSPTNKEYQEFSIKKCGVLTDYLHSLEVGDEITVRGPYGNHFPVEDKLKGKDLLFIAGGIGLAPLRSVINYVLDNRDDYGTVDIVYGSRSADQDPFLVLAGSHGIGYRFGDIRVIHRISVKGSKILILYLLLVQPLHNGLFQIIAAMITADCYHDSHSFQILATPVFLAASATAAATALPTRGSKAAGRIYSSFSSSSLISPAMA